MLRVLIGQTILLLVSRIVSVQIGSIQGVSFFSSTGITVLTNDSCTECICTMMLSDDIIGLSCSQNQTCLFFYNYSLPYDLTVDLNSSFYFRSLPPEQHYTTFETTTNIGTTIEQQLTAQAVWSATGDTVAGSGAAGLAGNISLTGPGPIAVDIDNNLYVNDYGKHRVILYPSNGSMPRVIAGTGTAGSKMNQFNSPNGIDIDTTGALYIADQNNHRIQRWLPGATNGTTVAGTTGTSGSTLALLNKPQCVSIDSSTGNMYIYDGQNYRVLKWQLGASQGIMVAGNGSTGTSLSNIAYAYDAKINSNGDIYVPDYNNGRVLKWTPPSTSGVLVAGQVSSSGSTSNRLKQPTQIIVNSAGDVYICDYGNHRIQRWINGASNGSTVAGNGTAGSNSNQLHSPYGIAFDRFNNLYVADSGNNRILRFNLTNS
ncbi:unnamed protein product [Adineta ricciae]|uniref:NHL repeat containing protein n=1 Tax=Adineta ricciae TaxID=249248 RepID=A0A813TL17_ADIRI|nr:unnamed protein product [Adineta ricciae]CAF1353571.1 unnamed protein product [Adineta ricciae]